MKKPLPSFPEENQAAPWPSLLPTQNDRAYTPKAAPQQKKAKHKPVQVLPVPIQIQNSLQPLDRQQLLMQDLRNAVMYGALLGLFLSGLLSLSVLQWNFWLRGWDWLYGLGAFLLFLLLVRLSDFGRAVFACCLLAAFIDLAQVVVQLFSGQMVFLFVLLGSLACCITIKVIAEWLYVPRES